MKDLTISIVISDQTTWPSNVIEYLESNYKKFLGWECDCPRSSLPQEYDLAIYGMRDVLKKYSLVGYHCTKLIELEIDNIRNSGMLLQNSDSLRERIYQLEEAGLLSADVAHALISRNQADDGNRAGMLWFFFYEPYLAGCYGIQRFFRFWGGEALYNLHEDHPDTGKVLKEIGIPCVIKANIPITSLKDSFYPDSSMIRVFLSQRGHQLDNGIEHEGFSTTNIAPQDIVEVIKHPNKQFIELTKCDAWSNSELAL